MKKEECLICKKEKEKRKIFCKECYKTADWRVKFIALQKNSYSLNIGNVMGRPREKPRNYTERFKTRFGGY